MHLFLCLITLCIPPGSRALTQFINSSTSVSGSFDVLSGYPLTAVRDNDVDTLFYAGSPEYGETLQIDFGTQKNLRSVYMLHEHDRSDYPEYKIYIGNTDFNGNYEI